MKNKVHICQTKTNLRDSCSLLHDPYMFFYDSYVERRVPTARKLLKRHIASVTLLRIAPSGSFKFFSLSFLAKKIESTHYI